MVNYEGLYDVSNMGRVRRNGRIRKQNYYSIYPGIDLCKNGKTTQYRVHRLVLEAYVGKRPDGMVCRHLDGDKRNNRIDNLTWGTQKENARDMVEHGRACQGTKNAHAVLNEEKVFAIRKLYAKTECKHQDLADLFGVCRTAIVKVLNGTRWGWLEDRP